MTTTEARGVVLRFARRLVIGCAVIFALVAGIGVVVTYASPVIVVAKLVALVAFVFFVGYVVEITVAEWLWERGFRRRMKQGARDG